MDNAYLHRCERWLDTGSLSFYSRMADVARRDKTLRSMQVWDALAYMASTN